MIGALISWEFFWAGLIALSERLLILFDWVDTERLLILFETNVLLVRPLCLLTTLIDVAVV